MRVLVTGSAGRVGRAVVPALQRAGHDVTGTDRVAPDFDRPAPGAPGYVHADLGDYGEVSALVSGASPGEGPKEGPFDAVVHAAAIPAPGHHAPQTVFANNLMALFHVVEACVRWGVPRLVNVSSETVPGFAFPERPFLPDYLPVDEEHPARPQDAYGLAKHLGEQVCDAAVRRSDLRVVTLRPTWVQDAGSWERNIGPLVAGDPQPSVSGWAYVDVEDLADAAVLAVACDLPGHEVFYVAAEDTAGGRDLHATWREVYPDSTTELRDVDRPDASGISTAKARRLLGWTPRRSWRDHLTDDGTARR